MASIERKPEPKEVDPAQKGFTPIGKYKQLSARDKFREELSKKEKAAWKQDLPFARHAALAKYEDFELSKKKEIKRQGFVSSDSLKEFKIDWAKYSDLKNFEVIREDEVPDKQLNQENPGLRIKKKIIEYKYIGFQNIYRRMEDSADAIDRAQKKRLPQPVVVKKEK